MSFAMSRLVCLGANGYNSVYAFVTQGDDKGSAIATAGFFNDAKAQLRVGDIIMAGVSAGGGVSMFVVTLANTSSGVSINGV